ncbi:MAG: right-handed parallel beta-helix repeat-containing protein, partial [Armatimonadetes bacterium]|nr:right-handed parallel beta-helix repeat-containing protein [Armatimonadota bacterium]
MPVAALFLASLLNAEPAADLYVAPNGNDTWTGKLAAPNPAATDGPFATPARARDALRAVMTAEKPRPWRVLLRGGVYPLGETLVFGPEDSGREGNPVTWAAYPGEKPILSGGRSITGWRKEADGSWSVTLPDAAQHGFNQLFVNGARRTRARQPNTGYLRTAGPLPEIKDPQKERDNTASRLGFTYRGDDLTTWPDLDEVNVVLYYDWSTSRHWIRALDPGARTVRFVNPTGWPVCFWEREQRFHLENARAFLDSPGEWYLDRKSGVLTYLPLPGEEPGKVDVVAPRLRRLVELRCDPAGGKFVDNLRFEGLSFQHAGWQFERTQQLEAQAAAYCTGAVWGQGVRNARFIGCEIAHAGEYGLWLESGCQGNVIRHCEIHDLGAGGVRLGAEGFTDQPNLISRYNQVDNCFIHDAGHVFPDGVGIWVGHSSDNQLTHNDICDIVYSG